jgi:hypothetical protein
MAFDAHVLKVLIASPGDTREERDAVESALHAWNADRSTREQVVLLPRRWETNAIPRLGSSGQSVINEQLVDDADIVLALFDSRLGMATSATVSGTAEEILRSHRAGKPVHIWFSEEPIPRDADLDQIQALNEFKDTLQPLGLLGSYASPNDLAFKVRQAIESDLDRLNLRPVEHRMPKQDHAILRANYHHERVEHVDGGGRRSYRTGKQRLVIRNIGTASAASLSVHIQSLDPAGVAPQLMNEDVHPTLVPHGEFSWPLFTHLGTAQVFEVIMNWTEGDAEFTESQHVSM